jgi:hypothetical protein
VIAKRRVVAARWGLKRSAEQKRESPVARPKGPVLDKQTFPNLAGLKRAKIRGARRTRFGERVVVDYRLYSCEITPA